MHFLPYFRFSVSCPDSEEQAFRQARTADIVLFGRDYRCTETEEERKRLLFYPESRRRFFHNPFLPIVLISFDRNPSGTSVTLVARLRSRVKAFLSALMIAGALAEAGVFLFCLIKDISLRYFAFAPIAFSAAVYLIAAGALFLLSNEFFRQFRNALRRHRK
ncbi:MAG: hypothetical protein IK118_01960 [Clostridia bacterium]|nr:hypothetical protein [Clostridia bacterium]